ncbi:hypothetical protein CEXT_506171 [Caerostris extrusa]|uniref:Uncharacterized protein n=1 Tax=Caerostris extrusa TaxID=172846 RepID=A0AAV4XCT5_CAEEX|nr:hypothetical protein CEXT_506171 [Caerostris extrusa]
MESAVETPVQSLEDDIHLHSVFKGTIHSSLSSIDRLVERRGKGVFHEVSPAHSSVRTRDAHAYTSIGALSVKLSSSDDDRYIFENCLRILVYCVVCVVTDLSSLSLGETGTSFRYRRFQKEREKEKRGENTPHFLFDTNKLTCIAFYVFFSEAQQDPTNPKRYPGSRVNSSSTLPLLPPTGERCSLQAPTDALVIVITMLLQVNAA